MRRSSGIVPLLLVLLLVPTLAAALDLPPLRNRRVNDDANIIPAETRQRIEQKLAEFERRTTNQIAVLTVESLEGDPIEDFSLRVAEAWKLGQAGKDNGVLLVVSEADRRMRIEVGYGLEPVLTDLETSLIQREVIVPAFRRGDYGGGIEAGVDAILAGIQGDEVEPAAGRQPLGGGRGGQGRGLPSFLLFALVFLVPFSLSAARSGSWLVGLFLTPFYFFLGSLVAPFLGIVAAGVWIVFFSVLRLLAPRRHLGRGYRNRGGGWWIGPGWGGGGGGWSGGGGGFSGGGGSFGGGGSSSSW